MMMLGLALGVGAIVASGVTLIIGMVLVTFN